MPLPPLRIALTGPWQLALLAALPLAALAALQALPVLPPLLPLLALAAACGVLTAWLRGLRRWRFALLLLSLLPLALAWGSWRATQQLEPALHPAWEGRPLRFEAEVLALPQAQTGHGGRLLWRLHLRPLGAAHDADLAAGADTDAPARVMLPEGLSLWFETEQVPRAGERWRFEARLKRVHALQNPGLPDAELWLLERGIRAQGTVLRAHKLADAAPWSLQAQRQALRDRLLPWLPIERERAVVAGLLIGDQAALSMVLHKRVLSYLPR